MQDIRGWFGVLITAAACGVVPSAQDAASAPDAGVDRDSTVPSPDSGGLDGGVTGSPDASPPVPPTPPTDLNEWQESATWRAFNGALELRWAHAGGDWVDADGMPRGGVPFSSVRVTDDNEPGPVEIDLLPLIEATGAADVFLRRSGGTNIVFHSREAAAGGPILTLNDSVSLPAVADTYLASSTSRALGSNETLASEGSVLIRFLLPEMEEPLTSAVLTLQSTGREFGDQTLRVFEPDPRVRTIERPAWLVTDPTVIIEFGAEDVLRDDLPVRQEGDIATSQLSAPGLTWINSNMVIPNQTQACVTVYQRLGTDFRPGDGGKLPGFSNTGDSLPGSDVVGGVTYPDSGWGGRSPDGLHWSARTGYGRWTSSHVASHTYFYAMAPHNAYGWVDPIGFPFAKGEWTAYVQCVRLNTISGAVGNEDGALYYEMSGVGPLYSRENIRWRDIDAPESEIREFWIDYYCGGTSCGDIENRGTVDFGGAVVTRGLPDMSAVAAEVERLNRTHP